MTKGFFAHEHFKKTPAKRFINEESMTVSIDLT